ncbi:MAG: hypothetical protein ACI4GD_12105 [Lachnospiraceae bacterium]
MMNLKKNWISKLLIALGVISALSTSFTAYADGNEKRYDYTFTYYEYGEVVQDTTRWVHKITSAPVGVECDTATSGFYVRVMGCESDTDSPSSALPVSDMYYISAGQSRPIPNSALTMDPTRAWIALKGVYQGDSFFTATGGFIPF